MNSRRKIAVHCRDLTVRFGDFTALDNISLEILGGSITAVIGPNGAGKTTLMKAILGIIPYRGEIHFHDSHGNRIYPRMSYIPQRLEFDHGIPLTVRDFLSLPVCRHPLWLPHRKFQREKMLELLQSVSAEHLLERRFGDLSGGEIQRVLMAQALMTDPELLLMDEPEAGVDVLGEERFGQLMRKIHAERELTLVMVSHDLNLVNRYCDQVICINRTLRCRGSSLEVLTSENLAEVFGGDLSIYTHHHNHYRQEGD